MTVVQASDGYRGCRRCRWAGRAITATGLLGVTIAVALRPREAVPVSPPPPTLMLFDIDAAPPAAPPVPVQPHVAQRVTPQQAASPTPPPAVPATLTAPVPVVRPASPFTAASDSIPPSPAAPRPAPPPAAPPVPDAPPAHVAAGSSATSWEGQVLARLAKMKAYPDAARRAAIEGTALVCFTVTRAGGLVAVSLVASSGSAMLDHAAIAAVTRAAPFPPIPPARPDRVELTVPVRFSLTAAEG